MMILRKTLNLLMTSWISLKHLRTRMKTISLSLLAPTSKAKAK